MGNIEDFYFCDLAVIYIFQIVLFLELLIVLYFVLQTPQVNRLTDTDFKMNG